MDDPSLPGAPGWFGRALAVQPEEGWVSVQGTRIHHLSWGEPGERALVLVHGGAAHVHWWSFIAPLLAATHHVVAIDLSGHGDSDWRDEYTVEGWAKEVVAVIDATGMGARPVLVGHSMGGLVSIAAAALHGERLDGVVIVDAPVQRPDPETASGRNHIRRGTSHKVYPDLETALSRFFVVPTQPVENLFLLRHVARHSLREVDGGWSWKFDRRIVQRFDRLVLGDYLADIPCRVAVFHAEHSTIVTPDINDYMAERLGYRAPFVEIPDAHHHLLLDQPLVFVAALRALLADWRHSEPAGQSRI